MAHASDGSGGGDRSSDPALDHPLLPCVGTLHDLQRAHSPGIRSVRVATHWPEAGISAQHIAAARGLGMDVAGFLMMSHWPNPPNWPARPS